MNILKLTIGNYYDNDYSEFIFKTKLLKRDFYNENFILTPNFIEFLKDNHFDDLLTQYYENRDNFEIDFYNDDNLTEITF